MYICSLSESNLSSNLILTREDFLTILFCYFDKETEKTKVPIQKHFQWLRMRMPAWFENVLDCL